MLQHWCTCVLHGAMCAAWCTCVYMVHMFAAWARVCCMVHKCAAWCTCVLHLCNWRYSRGRLRRYRNRSTILFFPTPWFPTSKRCSPKRKSLAMSSMMRRCYKHTAQHTHTHTKVERDRAVARKWSANTCACTVCAVVGAEKRLVNCTEQSSFEFSSHWFQVEEHKVTYRMEPE